MKARSGKPADRAWQTMVGLVMDTRDDWRRRVSEATGLPFSRVRALRRLDEGPMTLKELAGVLHTDAPAATVGVNDLEARGLVERRPHPDDGRAKLVSLTAAGRKMLATARAVTESAPPAVAALSAEEIGTLQKVLDAIEAKG